MTNHADVGVGLLGLGVVGGRVFDELRRNGPALARRAGRNLTVRAVAVRDTAARRERVAPHADLLDDPLALSERDDIDILIELIGGETPAADCIARALSAGKSVVTANKEVMAKHGPRLLNLAREHGVELRYEASVGGGIPIIGVLQRELRANDIRCVRAIINGTTNYMITEMSQRAAAYDEALQQAQALGYAEADPTNDVEGIDAAYKLAILASLAFHSRIEPHQVHREGIRSLSPRDFQHAADLGYTIRMLATARRTPRGLDLRVHPTLIPDHDPMARVDGVLNAVAVDAEPLGSVVLEGPGAGPGPTASAVLADLLDIAAAARPPRAQPPTDDAPALQPLADVCLPTYLRLTVPDRAGVLAELGHAFAAQGVSIASVRQVPQQVPSQPEASTADQPADQPTAELVVTTHAGPDGAIDRVLQSLAHSDSVLQIGVRLRIEDPRAHAHDPETALPS